MTDIELFDRWIAAAKIGPRRDLATLPGPVAEEYRRYLSKIKSTIDSAVAVMPDLAAIHTEFVQGSGLNAFAFREAGRYFVGINDGLPMLVAGTAHRMLADPLLFTNIGDASKETSADLPLFNGLKPDAQSIQLQLGRMRPAHGSEREFYAVHIADIVFDFIAAHELTHIAHGHTDYYVDECGLPFIQELGYVPNTASGNLDLQTMEMDADFHAAYLLTVNIKRVMGERHLLPTLAQFAFRDPPTAMFNLAVAVSILARLFEDDGITGVDLSTRSHPPWRWRQMMTLNAIANYASTLWDEMIVRQIEAAFSNAIVTVEKAFQIITGTGVHVAGLNHVWGPPGFLYAKSLMACWRTSLRTKLLKYSKKMLPQYELNWELPPATP
jgi:hypothetical protein